MSYKRTKLSDGDKKILEEIFRELEKITLPSTYRSGNNHNYHQVRTGSIDQKGARQTVFGYSKYRQKKNISKYTKLYPHILPLFESFIKSHKPSFNFDSVYVNKNVVCKRHVDSKNVGETLLIGLGKYTGGQTVLYINNKELKFHIKSSSLIFNGSELEHRSLPFEGIRYTLVFFKI